MGICHRNCPKWVTSRCRRAALPPPSSSSAPSGADHARASCPATSAASTAPPMQPSNAHCVAGRWPAACGGSTRRTAVDWTGARCRRTLWSGRTEGGTGQRSRPEKCQRCTCARAIDAAGQMACSVHATNVWVRRVVALAGRQLAADDGPVCCQACMRPGLQAGTHATITVVPSCP